MVEPQEIQEFLQNATHINASIRQQLALDQENQPAWVATIPEKEIITYKEAGSRFKIFHSFEEDYLVLLFKGDVVIDGDLNDQWIDDCLIGLTWTGRLFGVLIDGNLTVRGDIVDDPAVSVYVLKDLSCDFVFSKDGGVSVNGNATVKYGVYGENKEGMFIVFGKLYTPYIVDLEHSMPQKAACNHIYFVAQDKMEKEEVFIYYGESSKYAQEETHLLLNPLVWNEDAKFSIDQFVKLVKSGENPFLEKDQIQIKKQITDNIDFSEIEKNFLGKSKLINKKVPAKLDSHKLLNKNIVEQVSEQEMIENDTNSMLDEQEIQEFLHNADQINASIRQQLALDQENQQAWVATVPEKEIITFKEAGIRFKISQYFEEDDLVLLLKGDVVIDGDLNDQWINDCLKGLTWTGRLFGVLIDGNLTVRGDIVDDPAVNVYVLKDLSCDFIFSKNGGITVNGDARAKYGVYGEYNDGLLIVFGKLFTPYIIDQDHCMPQEAACNHIYFIAQDRAEKEGVFIDYGDSSEDAREETHLLLDPLVWNEDAEFSIDQFVKLVKSGENPFKYIKDK